MKAYGYVWCKSLALNIGDCDHVNVGPVSFNWGCKRTTEDDMHPGSDHPGRDHPGSDPSVPA